MKQTSRFNFRNVMSLLNLSIKTREIGRVLQFLGVIVRLLGKRDVTRSCKQRTSTHTGSHCFTSCTVRNKNKTIENLKNTKSVLCIQSTNFVFSIKIVTSHPHDEICDFVSLEAEVTQNRVPLAFSLVLYVQRKNKSMK